MDGWKDASEAAELMEIITSTNLDPKHNQTRGGS